MAERTSQNKAVPNNRLGNTSGNITSMQFKCRYRHGLSFTNLTTCEARRKQAEKEPHNPSVQQCKDCEGPYAIPTLGVDVTKTEKRLDIARKQTESATDMCKCGRGPVVIRKNGVSAGRCHLCMSETAKSWGGSKKRSMQKSKTNEIDNQALVRFLKERKSAAEQSFTKFIENNNVNDDNIKSHLIFSISALFTALDAVGSANILPGWDDDNKA